MESRWCETQPMKTGNDPNLDNFKPAFNTDFPSMTHAISPPAPLAEIPGSFNKACFSSVST